MNINNVITFTQLKNHKSVLISVPLLFLISLSIFAQIIIQTEKGLLYTDVLVIQASSDENVELAVSTFKDHYLSGAKIKVILVSSEEELCNSMKNYPFSSTIIFGHGDKEGLNLRNDILDWNDLKTFINNEIEKFIPVMACYSGSVEGFYGGFPSRLDAETAGIMGAYYLLLEKGKNNIIENAIISKALLKQKKMAHPLFTIGKKYKSSGAAEADSFNLRVSSIVDLEGSIVPIVRPKDFFLENQKNPYRIDRIIIKKEVKGVEQKIEVDIMYVVEGHAMTSDISGGIIPFIFWVGDVIHDIVLVIAGLAGLITDFLLGGFLGVSSIDWLEGAYLDLIDLMQYNNVELFYYNIIVQLIFAFILSSILFACGLLTGLAPFPFNLIAGLLVIRILAYVITNEFGYYSEKISEKCPRNLFSTDPSIDSSDLYIINEDGSIEYQDNDNDGIWDLTEQDFLLSSSDKIDSDLDGITDIEEIGRGFDPNNPSSPGNYKMIDY